MNEAIGLPNFLLEALTHQYDEATRVKILDGMNARRAVTLRANTLKTDAESVAAALNAAGISFSRAPFWENAFILDTAREKDVWALPIYTRGEIYLQSLSSMLPPLALNPRAGADILDMAAAPGGKTTQMAAMTRGRAAITACELDKIRAEKLRHNLALQGASRVNVMVQDARRLEDFFRFDQILLDAPCSGSGTILAGESASFRAFSEALVKNSARAQLALLKKALSILKPGCEMVYSTCSILAVENEDVVRAALKGAKADTVPIDFPGASALPLLPCALDGALCVCPGPLYEGFFMAKIRKRRA